MKMTKFLAVMIAAVMFGSVSLSAAEAAPAEEAPGTWSKIGRTALLYIPNLVADVLDLVSFEFSVGPTAAVDVHATYYLDFGLENTDAYYVGSKPGHRWGAGRREAQRIGFVCWSYEDIYHSQSVGSMPSFAMKDCSFNMVKYYTNAFADYDVDLFAIGAKVSMLFGVAVDVHLRELPDLLCQIVAYDLADDNWK